MHSSASILLTSLIIEYINSDAAAINNSLAFVNINYDLL